MGVWGQGSNSGEKTPFKQAWNCLLQNTEGRGVGWDQAPTGCLLHPIKNTQEVTEPKMCSKYTK